MIWSADLLKKFVAGFAHEISYRNNFISVTKAMKPSKKGINFVEKISRQEASPCR